MSPTCRLVDQVTREAEEEIGGANVFSAPNKALFVITGADEVAVLPRAIRAWKSESFRGENHSYRKGDTH
jgi:hypothetical protein